jgi:hypothetical protein
MTSHHKKMETKITDKVVKIGYNRVRERSVEINNTIPAPIEPIRQTSCRRLTAKLARTYAADEEGNDENVSLDGDGN